MKYHLKSGDLYLTEYDNGQIKTTKLATNARKFTEEEIIEIQNSSNLGLRVISTMTDAHPIAEIQYKSVILEKLLKSYKSQYYEEKKYLALSQFKDEIKKCKNRKEEHDLKKSICLYVKEMNDSRKRAEKYNSELLRDIEKDEKIEDSLHYCSKFFDDVMSILFRVDDMKVEIDRLKLVMLARNEDGPIRYDGERWYAIEK